MSDSVSAKITILHFLFFIFPQFAITTDIIARTSGGDIRGKIFKSANGNEFFAFRGIPYAESPVDNLRFKPPIPKTPWHGVLDATKEGPVCIQKDTFSPSIIGQEDCLILNVYTPKLASTSTTRDKLPVMVWIHGGGFFLGSGSSHLYGPGLLIDLGIVVVTINYRLSVLGFLTTADSVIPGNFGLLDQTEALKWVKSNIAQLGGDENQITIFGQSAGGASVLYHLISPLSKGLFHKVIAMSGSPLCSWGFQQNPLRVTKMFADNAKCPFNKSEELLECLRKMSAKDITKAALSIHELTILITPVLDGNFLTRPPLEILTSGEFSKMPVLIGITKDEGIGILAFFQINLPNMKKLSIEDIIRPLIDFDDKNINSVKELYFKDVNSEDEIQTLKATSQLLSDIMFKFCNYDTIRLLTREGVKTYSYSYDFVSNVSLLQFFGIKENFGVAHSDELPNFFDGKTFSSLKYSDRAKTVQSRMRKLFTNFAKYGDPTIDLEKEWPISKEDETNVYHIDENDFVVNKFKIEDNPRYENWAKISEDLQKVKDMNKDEL